MRAEGLHRASEGRPGHYPRQPGQGGNAAAVTSLYWVRTRPSTRETPEIDPVNRFQCSAEP